MAQLSSDPKHHTTRLGLDGRNGHGSNSNVLSSHALGMIASMRMLTNSVILTE